MWKMCLIFRLLLLSYSIYVLSFSQDYFWILHFTARFSSLNHQEYWKKIWFKCLVPYHATFSQGISLITIILDSVWQYYQFLFFFHNLLFHVYLCNLRWNHNRFQTSEMLQGASFISQYWKFGKLISLLYTCHIHANFQTCSICRTAEL